ncbi:hypothetical protein ACIBG7_08025 [Nonomuraea sp. NPDC050328]|uniref:hypothetical protein n=1 Tax=Nonomuraea sp. NPDC050328 TaxID=3364361 RepID=UPI0037AF046E
MTWTPPEDHGQFRWGYDTPPGPPPHARSRALPVAASLVLALAVSGMGAVGLRVAGMDTGEPPPETGYLVEAPVPDPVRLADLETGMCVNGVFETAQAKYLFAVPCQDFHDGEVLAVFSAPDGRWPGKLVLKKLADTECAERTGVRIKAGTDSGDPLRQLTLIPSLQGWRDDQKIACLAVHRDEGQPQLLSPVRGGY